MDFIYVFRDFFEMYWIDPQIPLRPKMVYMAPMKSLCSEKFREWHEKFETSLRGAVRILELTGDSASADVADIRAYNLILTTPEKWDALTRRWKDHTGLVRMIKLVMIDEVHTINDSSREAISIGILELGRVFATLFG